MFAPGSRWILTAGAPDHREAPDMPQTLGFLNTVFVIWMLVECVRRRQFLPWGLIILFFQFFGAVAYYVFEIQTFFPIPGFGDGDGGGGSSSRVRFRTQRVSGSQVSEAEVEVRRLDNAPAWSDLAVLLGAKKRWAASEEAAAKALAKDPDELAARYARGRALLELERHDEAIAELEAVLSREANHDYGDARLALAKAHEAKGDLGAALAQYERLSDGSSRPDVLYHLAEVQHRCGDDAGARATLQRILDEAELVPSFARRQQAPWVARAKRTLRSYEA